jgi:hypothetical protein
MHCSAVRACWWGWGTVHSTRKAVHVHLPPSIHGTGGTICQPVHATPHTRKGPLGSPPVQWLQPSVKNIQNGALLPPPGTHSL